MGWDESINKTMIYLLNKTDHNIGVDVMHKGKNEHLDLITGKATPFEDADLASKVKKKVNKVIVECDENGIEL